MKDVLIAIPESEYKKLKGFENVIETLKSEGFDTVAFIRDELTAYKQYRLKVANGEIK